MNALDAGAVLAAAQRLEGIVNRTPVLTSRTLNEMTGQSIFFKCENFQRVGAFKFRGAYNAIAALDSDRLRAGVITHSSGNHAQGVALAASLLGARAVVVMPEDAPRIKREATAGYGAEIVSCKAKERESVTDELIKRHGFTLIHPYDNDQIIAGQGTAALELFDEVSDMDALFVPVGGGGLISGCALAASLKAPGCQVIGVEPEMADDARRSWESGELVVLDEVPSTIADGLRPRYIGQRNLVIMRKHVSDMVAVSESQIMAALKVIWERLKILVEPSAAVALAPLLAGSQLAGGQRVGILLSGGNVDMTAAIRRIEGDKDQASTAGLAAPVENKRPIIRVGRLAGEADKKRDERGDKRSADQGSPSLTLDVLPLDEVLPHELVQENRVARLMLLLERDGILINPPIVLDWQGHYILLDGATRYTALARLGFQHIIAQVVSADTPGFVLQTWHHVIAGIQSLAALQEKLAQLPGLRLSPLDEADLPNLYTHRPSAVCYLIGRESGLTLVEATRSEERLHVLTAMVSQFNVAGKVERTLLADRRTLTAQHPEMICAAIYPRLSLEEVFGAAVRGDLLPAGVTRFVVPGRILRLRASLSQLEKDETLSAKRDWLRHLVADRLSSGRLRYYEEPVVLLDD